MDRRRVPGEAAAGEQGMRRAIPDRREAPGEAVFRPARVLADRPARNRRSDLHAPARAEDRQAGLQRRAHQVELPPHGGAVLGEAQGGAGEDHAVEPRQIDPGPGIGGIHQRADRLRGEVGHHGGEGLRGGLADGGLALGAAVTVVAVGDQQAQHRMGHGRQAVPGQSGRGRCLCPIRAPGSRAQVAAGRSASYAATPHHTGHQFSAYCQRISGADNSAGAPVS